jgi:hypothetical protein
VTIEQTTGTIKEMGANQINPFGTTTGQEKLDIKALQDDIEKYSNEYYIPTE